MKLYMNALSPNVRRVRMTAMQLGMPLEEHPMDFAKGEHKAPDYIAMNANGAVPTLVDGDFVLTESRAIMQYLAAKKPEGNLLPKDEMLRADVTRWQFWDAAHFSTAVGTISFEKVFKPMFGMGDANQAKVEEGLGNFRRWAAVLDKRLANAKFVVGNTMTIADITLACSLMYATQAEIPVAEFPHVAAWFERMTALDSWKQSAPKMG